MSSFILKIMNGDLFELCIDRDLNGRQLKKAVHNLLKEYFLKMNEAYDIEYLKLLTGDDEDNMDVIKEFELVPDVETIYVLLDVNLYNYLLYFVPGSNKDLDRIKLISKTNSFDNIKKEVADIVKINVSDIDDYEKDCICEGGYLDDYCMCRDTENQDFRMYHFPTYDPRSRFRTNYNTAREHFRIYKTLETPSKNFMKSIKYDIESYISP